MEKQLLVFIFGSVNILEKVYTFIYIKIQYTIKYNNNYAKIILNNNNNNN